MALMVNISCGFQCKIQLIHTVALMVDAAYTCPALADSAGSLGASLSPNGARDGWRRKPHSRY
jgi:hypothetical protein